jgi:hypothetical protein
MRRTRRIKWISLLGAHEVKFKLCAETCSVLAMQFYRLEWCKMQTLPRPLLLGVGFTLPNMVTRFCSRNGFDSCNRLESRPHFKHDSGLDTLAVTIRFRFRLGSGFETRLRFRLGHGFDRFPAKIFIDGYETGAPDVHKIQVVSY